MSLRAQGRNFRLMAVFSLLGMGFSFLVGAQTARQFADGMQWLGYQAFFNAIEFPVTLFGANWLNPSLIKFINQERQHVAKVLWTNTILKCVFSSLLGLVALSLAWVCDIRGELLWMFACLLGTNITLSCGLSQAFDAFGKGALDARWHSITQFLYLVAALGLLWGLNIQGAQIWLLSLAEFGITCLYIAGLWWTFHRKVKPLPPSWSARQAREQIRMGWPLILSGLTEKLSGNLDITCLKWAGGAEGAVWCALYSIPQRILRILRQVIGQAFRQFTPVMVKNYHADRALSARTFSMGFRLVGVFALTLWVVMGVNAEGLITVLFSGSYAASAPCLVWLMGGFAFRHLAKVCNNVLIAAGDSRTLARNQYVVAGFVVVAVPTGAFAFGAQGAAAGVMATYLAAFLQAWRQTLHCYEGHERPDVLRLGTPFVVSAGLCLWWIPIVRKAAEGWGLQVWELSREFFTALSGSLHVKVGYVHEVVVGSVSLLPSLALSLVVTVILLVGLGPFTPDEKLKVRGLLAGMTGTGRPA
ncbi:MAG: oligosaccharide flippase family protein [Planctomycetota bacterium]